MKKKPTNKTPAVKGKPRKDLQKRKLLDALTATHGIITPACAAAGISRQTYYAWLEADPAFAQDVEDILSAQLDFVESNLLERIQDGDTTATIFYLKTKGKERGYAERTEITGRDGRDLLPQIQIQVIDASHADD